MKQKSIKIRVFFGEKKRIHYSMNGIKCNRFLFYVSQVLSPAKLFINRSVVHSFAWPHVIRFFLLFCVVHVLFIFSFLYFPLRFLVKKINCFLFIFYCKIHTFFYIRVNFVIWAQAIVRYFFSVFIFLVILYHNHFFFVVVCLN